MTQTRNSHNDNQSHGLRHSVTAAWSGLAATVRTQWNMRVHLVLAFTITALGGALRISSWEWCTLVLTIAGVMCLELVNTAIEAAVDLVTLEVRPLAQTAKDAAAAAVLVMAVASVIVGAVIFLPRIVLLLQR